MFDFLGFSFQPRRIYEVKDGKANLWWGYCTAISTKAARHIRNQIRTYKIHQATGAELEQIAQSLASKLRGWIRYFRYVGRPQKSNNYPQYVENQLFVCG